jgi:nicotinamidase-related amidase
VTLPDDAIADLLAVVLSGRAEPFVDLALGEAAPALAPELSAMREALASLGLAEPPAPPSAGLRSRILGSLAAAAPPHKALLVVDMQNDHLTPGGPHEVPRAREIVPALAARLDAARREGTPIVYVVDEHEPGDSDLDTWGAHNVKGTPGAAVWPALAPGPKDLVVPKPTYSAFTRSRLAEVLSELRVDTLVLTGCLTEVGLTATAYDALQRGYAVEIPPDCQAGATEASERAALGLLMLLPPYGPAREAVVARARA